MSCLQRLVRLILTIFSLFSGNKDIQADPHSLNETFRPIARVGGHFLDKEIYKQINKQMIKWLDR